MATNHNSALHASFTWLGGFLSSFGFCWLPSCGLGWAEAGWVFCYWLLCGLGLQAALLSWFFSRL